MLRLVAKINIQQGGGTIFMAESGKSPEKVVENRKREKKSAEHRKK